MLRGVVGESTSSSGGSVDESAVWEASYAAVVRTEQRDTAALLAFLDDARAAKLEARGAGEADLSARLRCGTSGAGEEAEMRSDREAAVAVLVDESAERDRRVVGEALRRETRFGGDEGSRGGGVRGGRGRRGAGPAGRNYRDDDDGDRNDEDVVRPPTPRSRAPREPAARTRDVPRRRRQRQRRAEDLGSEEEDRYLRAGLTTGREASTCASTAPGTRPRFDSAARATRPTRPKGSVGARAGHRGRGGSGACGASAGWAAAASARAPPAVSVRVAGQRVSVRPFPGEDRAEDARGRRDVGRRRPSGKVSRCSPARLTRSRRSRVAAGFRRRYCPSTTSSGGGARARSKRRNARSANANAPRARTPTRWPGW